MMSHLTYKNLLLFIASLAGVLGAWGVLYGLPLHLIGDEESMVGGALKMLELRTLIPSLHPAEFDFFYYPPIISYLIITLSIPLIFWQWMAHGFSVLAVEDYFALQSESLFLAARLISVAGGVATIIVVYALGRLLYERRVALAASGFLAVSFLFVNAAHWSRHWMLATLIGYLTGYAAVRLVKRQDIRWWWPALLAAVGVGVSYISLYAAGVAAIYLFIHWRDIKQFWRFFAGSTAVFFAVSSMFVLLNLNEITKLVGSEDGTGTVAKSLPGLWSVIMFALGVLWRQESVLFVLAILGIIFAARYLKQNICLALACLGYFVVLYLLFHIELRYVYFIMPALALMVGTLVDLIFSRKWPLAASAVVLCFALALVTVGRYDWLLTQTDTRLQALEWIGQEARESDMIWSSRSLYLPRTRQALEREKNYANLRAPERYLDDNFDRLYNAGSKLANYTNLHFWSADNTLDDLNRYVVEFHPTYFVLEYSDISDLDAKDYSLMAGSRLVREFRQSSLDNNYDLPGNFTAPNNIFWHLERLGPTIRIYEL